MAIVFPLGYKLKSKTIEPLCRPIPVLLIGIGKSFGIFSRF
jgi:hypothetical protein